MARFSTWGSCRNPSCNHSLRANSKSVYCNRCTLRVIRYADPDQQRIMFSELKKPLQIVARLRKQRQDVPWHLFAENWLMLANQCRGIANSRSADLKFRRRAAWTIEQIADSVSPDRVVDLIVACFVLEADDRHNGRRRFRTDQAFRCCVLQVLRREGRVDRAFNVGGHGNRTHVTYRRLHITARDIACQFIWDHLAVVGATIARAVTAEWDREIARKQKLRDALSFLEAVA